MPHRYSYLFLPLAAIFDLLGLNIAFILAYQLKFGKTIFEIGHNYIVLWVLSIVIWIVIIILKRPYLFSRVKFHVPEVLIQFFGLIIIHISIIAFYWLIINNSTYSRKQIFIFYFFWILIGGMGRVIGTLILKIYRASGYNNRKYIIIGYGSLAKSIKHFYNNNIEMGYRFYGFFDNKNKENSNFLNGSLENVEDYIVTKQIDCIYCCISYIDSKISKKIVGYSEKYNIEVKIIVDFTSFLDRSTYIEYHDVIPVISFSKNFRDNFKVRFLKRAFDVCFSSLAIIFGLPVFILVSIITKLTSKGPIFYSQERVGWRGIPFTIYKFRSMYVNAESMGPALSSGEEDKRITPWGKVMRKSRLDELPQFYNVLIGDMSIVGPRPERQFFIDQIIEIAPEYSKLLSLKPGITSLGQIKYGYASNVEEMVKRLKYDLLYLDKFSIFLDSWLILQTLVVMVKGKGK